MKRLVVLAALASSVWMLAGCAEEEDCTGRLCARSKNAADDPQAGADGDASGTAPGVTCSDAAKERLGLGGRSLKREREEGVSGADRRRTKPFAVLASEFSRTVGNAPASLGGLAASFGEPSARWYTEPKPSAVAIASTFDVAFESCVTFTATEAAYAAAPEISTATAACSAMARKFWSRVVTPADVDGCVQVATVDSVEETYATGDDGAPMTQRTTPRRRWAYACATLLTSTPFLAY